MRSLIRAVYRFRDAALVAEKKDDFGNALQNLYRELERAEDSVGLALQKSYYGDNTDSDPPTKQQ